MIFKDYYKILDLHTSKISLHDIKAAYREAAKKNHPDLNVGDKYSEEKFKDINEAYRVLSNPSSKRKYDRMWNSRVGSKNNQYEESKRDTDSLFSDFFNMFFGKMGKNEDIDSIESKRTKKAARGENIDTEISLSIAECFYGATKKISLRTVEGKMKTFTIKVPSGIRNHEKIRLLGQGKKGLNGGKNGDLFIKVNIEDDKKFKLEGYDIHTDLFLTPWEAALGIRAQVEGIDEISQLYIPQGIQSGEKVRIPGKGYKDGKGGRGDLVAEIKIMVPKKLSKQEEELFKKLSEVSKYNPRGNKS